MITFLPDNSETKITEKLNCTVRTFSGRYQNTSQSTKYIIMSGELKSPSIAASGHIAAVINSQVDVNGSGLEIETIGFSALEQKLCVFTPGIPGQLSYIDGCSNSNLIDPPRNGEPCLNYLFFPQQICQSFHTHPSVRIGLVLSGRGVACVGNETYELTPGTSFVLNRHAIHRFSTTDSHMSLAVFHPDSEDGPRDEFNPMKSRTYLK